MGALLLLLLLAPEEPHATFDLADVNVTKIASTLETYFGAKIVIPDEYAERTVTLKVQNATVQEVLESVGRQLQAELHREADGSWRFEPCWRTELARKVKETKIGPTKIAKAPLRESLENLGRVVGVPVVVDPAVGDAVLELSLKGVTVEQALDLATPPDSLAWDLRYGVVFVSTPSRLEELPAASPALPNEPAQRKVTLDHVDKPVAEILKEWGIGVARESEEAAGKLRVTIRAGELPLPQALALLLHPHGWQARWRDDAVEVRSP